MAVRVIGQYINQLAQSFTVGEEDGIFVTADNFEYDKITNILIANGNVVVDDKIKDSKIYSENITYFKNKEYTAKALSEMKRVARKGVYIGNVRHTAQEKRKKHIIEGTTTHLLHDIDDFPGYQKCEALYDEKYYFCCYNKTVLTDEEEEAILRKAVYANYAKVRLKRRQEKQQKKLE